MDDVSIDGSSRADSVMRSYPNYLPLSASEVQRVGAAVTLFAFDRLYGAWWGLHIDSDAKAAVERSVERIMAHLAGTDPGYGSWASSTQSW